MDLLVAFKNDPAGHNMAKYIYQDMNKDGDLYRGKNFDLIEIDTPAISADWLDEKYDYDGFVFLSKHAAESGTLALTCHSTGNFDEAKFGGNQKELAIPYPIFQKRYLKKLWDNHDSFSDFEITFSDSLDNLFSTALDAFKLITFIVFFSFEILSSNG